MLRRTPLTPMRMTPMRECTSAAARARRRHGPHTERIDEGLIRALRYYVSPA